MNKLPPQRLNQRQINYYLQQVYKVLKSGKNNFIIKRLNIRFRGLTSDSNIWIDPQQAILPTLIHECLHVSYPNKSENEILKLEKKVAKRISERQIKRLLILFAEALKKSKQTSSADENIKEFLPRS